MFPQFLVQNTLLVENNKFIEARFAELFNTNIFHIYKLTDELIHYKNSLQLWKEVDNDPENLNYHEYTYDTNGALVGRVSKNLGDPLVQIQQPLTKYESVVRSDQIVLEPILDPARPSLIRSFFVAGLKNPKQLPITEWKYNNSYYSYSFDPTDSQWISNVEDSNNVPIQFCFTNDIIFGRLFFGYPSNNDFIKNVPIKIERSWNPYVNKYNYTCAFASVQLPNDVYVELY